MLTHETVKSSAKKQRNKNYKLDKINNQFMIIVNSHSLSYTIKPKGRLLNQIAKYIHKLISLTSIGIAFMIAMGLPHIGHIATAYLLVYAIILYFNRKIWPILLLISVPLLNLTPYSGRFAINEFDSLILLSFGLTWFKQEKPQLPKISSEFILIITLLVISIISGLMALSSFPGAEEQYLTIYQQPENIWRISKSLVYALLLYLLIHNTEKTEIGLIIRNIALGATASLCTLTLIILWEKGVFYQITSGNSIYNILSSALRFSIDYRPTALFTGMHVGGGSIDSYIAIMFLFPCLLLFATPSNTSKSIFLLALLTGLYCAFATVSRTVIAVTGLTIATIVLFQLFTTKQVQNTNQENNGKKQNTLLLTGLLFSWMLSQFLSQFHMGTEGALFFPLFTVAIILAYYQSKIGHRYILVITLSLISLLLLESLADYSDKGLPLDKIIIKGSIVIGLIILNAFFSLHTFRSYSQIKLLSFPLIIFIFSTIFISIGFGAASLTNRLSDISLDTHTREQHWNTVKSTGNDSLFNMFLGNGPGTMPLHYPFAFTNADYFTAQQINKDEGGIAITASQGTLIQRTQIKQQESYTLYATVRAKEGGGYIRSAICNRNIIIQTAYNPTCKETRQTIKKSNNWQSLKIPLSTQKLFKPNALSIPIGFELTLHEFPNPIEIQFLVIHDSNGVNILKNSDFKQGLDNWFWVSDFQHLGWHSKNSFLHQYFELGTLGLLCTVLLISASCIKMIITRKSTDLSTKFFTTSLCLSFILMGAFITILDDPQIATFWYLGFLIASLLLSSEKIDIPPLEISSLKLRPLPINTLATFKKTKTKTTIQTIQTIKNKPLITLVVIILILAATSIEYYARHFYDISTPQLIARIKHSKLDELKYNHPTLNIAWNLLDAIAPDDKRFEYNNSPTLPQTFFWSQPEILKLVGPQQTTKESQLYIREVRVSDEKELLTAIKNAIPGDDIIIEPGYYHLVQRYIEVKNLGNNLFPIRVRAKTLGNVQINMTTTEGFQISAPYWSFENLKIKGVSENKSGSEHAFHIVGNAHHTTIKNNRVQNFNAHIKINGYKGYAYPDYGLIIANQLTNDTIKRTKNPVTPIDAVGVNNWLVTKNIISDFAKLWGTQVSYAGFFKGGGTNNSFTKNLIICELNHSGGIRIGLSFGGGGTGKTLFREGNTRIEHNNGLIKNNIIANCPNDVGIYINKGSNTKIESNLIIDSLGIDIRFKESSASIKENEYNGRINKRNSAQIDLFNNTKKSLSIKNINDWPEIMNYVRSTLRS